MITLVWGQRGDRGVLGTAWEEAEGYRMEEEARLVYLELACRDTWTTWWMRWELGEVEEVVLATDRDEGRTSIPFREVIHRGGLSVINRAFKSSTWVCIKISKVVLLSRRIRVVYRAPERDHGCKSGAESETFSTSFPTDYPVCCINPCP